MKKNRKLLSVCFGSLFAVAAVSAPLMMTSCKENNEPKKPVQPEAKRVNFEIDLFQIDGRPEKEYNDEILKLSYLDDGSKSGIKKCRIEGWTKKLPSNDNLKIINKQFSLKGKNFLITEIADNAFASLKTIQQSFTGDIFIPKCIERIGANAFKNQFGIKSVTFMGAPTIEANAFAGCDNMEEIILDYKDSIVPKVNDSAFAKENIKFVKASTETMEVLSKDPYWQKLYNNNKVFTKKVVPALSLADETYGSIEILLPKGDKTKTIISKPELCNVGDHYSSNFLAEGAVKFNKDGTFVYENETYTMDSIDARAFAGLGIAEGIFIPETISKIGENAFETNDIEYVEFADGSSKIIGAGAFQACVNLSNIKFSNTTEEIGDSAFSSTAIENLELPSSLKKIGNEVFSSCEKLTEVTIPDTVTEIGAEAFNKCVNLNTVKLGKNIKKIGANTFANINTDLTISFENVLQIPELEQDGYFIDAKTCKVKNIIVPKGQSALYKEKMPKFIDIIIESTN